MDKVAFRLQNNISIHAPREGGDLACVGNLQKSFKISIHAPREGGDGDIGGNVHRNAEFQSTPPARGATDRIQA